MAGRQREDERLIQAAVAESQAKQQLTAAQIQDLAEGRQIDRRKLDLMAQEIGDKMTISREETAGKKEIAGMDVGQRDRAAKLAALVTLAGTSMKLQSDIETGKQTALTDLIKRPDINTGTLAQAFKAAGQPALANALDLEHRNKTEALIQQSIPGIQRAKSDQERTQKIKPTLDAMDPTGTAYQRALALAYPKPGVAAPELPKGPEVERIPGVAPAGTPTQTNDMNANLVNSIMKIAGYDPVTGQPDVAGAQDRRTGQAPAQSVPFSAMTTPQRIEAGYPTMSGGIVYNQPAGTAGYDFNMGTGQWIPKSSGMGTINGVPSAQAVADIAMKTGRPPGYSSDETYALYNTLRNTPNIAELGRRGIASYPTPAGEAFVPAEQLVSTAGGVIPKPAGIDELTPPPPVVAPPVEKAPAPGTELGWPASPQAATPVHNLVGALFGGRPPWVTDADIQAQQDRAAAEAARRAAEEEARRRAEEAAKQAAQGT